MKKYIIAVFVAVGITASAQTNTTTSAILSGFKSSTNWVFIPFGKYDIQHKTVGFGGAALYEASPNLWTGIRFDNIDSQQTTAGLQAQLQVTGTAVGISYTPFIETSVGLGSSSLYGSVGGGMLISLHTFTITSKVNLDVGIVGDYEHVINGANNYNCVNVGPSLHLSF